MRRLLPLMLVIGCGPGPADSDLPPELVQRPRHGDMEPFHNEALQDLERDSGADDEGPQNGPPRLVEVTITLPSAPRVRLALLGVALQKLEGAWVRDRAMPDFYWISRTLDFTSDLVVTAPLPVGLHYIAVLNQDDDGLPGPGDLVSAPTELRPSHAGSFALRVDRTFEDAARSQGSPMPTADASRGGHGGRTYAVSVELADVPAPPGPCTLMVIGRDPEIEARDGTAAYFWRSEPVEPIFPLRFDMPLPEEGLHVLAVIDLNGDRVPGDGDIATEFDREYRRPGPSEKHTFVIGAPYPAELKLDLREFLRREEAHQSPAFEQVERRLLVDSLQPPASSPGARFLVAGFPPTGAQPFVWPPAARPLFLWRSEPQELKWPAVMTARFPRGLDLLVVLDLDGDGEPGPGDLSSAPAMAFEPPPDGQTVYAELLRVLRP